MASQCSIATTLTVRAKWPDRLQNQARNGLIYHGRGILPGTRDLKAHGAQLLCRPPRMMHRMGFWKYVQWKRRSSQWIALVRLLLLVLPVGNRGMQRPGLHVGQLGWPAGSPGCLEQHKRGREVSRARCWLGLESDSGLPSTDTWVLPPPEHRRRPERGRFLQQSRIVRPPSP